MNPAVDWLMGLQRFGMKPGLERMRLMLERLGNPERSSRVVLVGGTNGKGSTASALAAMLNADGSRTGLFTSPHLTNVMERFLVGPEQLPVSALEAAVMDVRPLAEELGATFFEVMVACAWLLFRAHECQTVIMEVGLGGRYDATNASDPVLSVVTNVDLDHTEILGGSVAEIARDKAHLMRPDRPVLTAATGEALSVLDRHARQIGASLAAAGRDFSVAVSQSPADPGTAAGLPSLTGRSVNIRSADWSADLTVPLPGRHQALNAALAAMAAHTLGVSDAAIGAGLKSVNWPGRLEHVRYRQRNWLLDGAHNPAGARALREAIEDLGARPAVLIVGVTGDKDVPGLLTELRDIAPLVIATRSALSPRALEPAEFLELLPPLAQSAATPAAAVEKAIRASKPDELTVVAGSLYLLGEVRPLLRGGSAEAYSRWQ